MIATKKWRPKISNDMEAYNYFSLPVAQRTVIIVAYMFSSFVMVHTDEHFAQIGLSPR